jgi:hypothetical protein
VRRHGVHRGCAVRAQAAPQPAAAGLSTGLASHVRPYAWCSPATAGLDSALRGSWHLGNPFQGFLKLWVSVAQHMKRLLHRLEPLENFKLSYQNYGLAGRTRGRRQRRSGWRWRGSSCAFCWGRPRRATRLGCGGCRSAPAQRPAAAPASEPRTQVHAPCCSRFTRPSVISRVCSCRMCCLSECTVSAGKCRIQPQLMQLLTCRHKRRLAAEPEPQPVHRPGSGAHCRHLGLLRAQGLPR